MDIDRSRLETHRETVERSGAEIFEYRGIFMMHFLGGTNLEFMDLQIQCRSLFEIE